MADIQFIKPPNGLKKVKVGTGTARLDQALIRRAETAVEALQKEDAAWAMEEFAAIEGALERLSVSGGDMSGLRTLGQNLTDLRAQAASYGYSLMSDIAGNIIEFLYERQHLSEADIVVVETFVSALRAIHLEGRRGDGGPLGRELYDCLAALTAEPATGR